MGLMRKGVYFGIDINSKYTIVSFYQLNMATPSTISTVVGSERYKIPTVIAKKNGIAQWYFGYDAITQEKNKNATLVDNLYEKAINNETVSIEDELFEARDLLAIFLKRILGVPGRFSGASNINRLTFAVEELSINAVETFSYIAKQMEIDESKLSVIDYKESFYFYALSQEEELKQHDIILYEHYGNILKKCHLSVLRNTTPKVCNIDYTERRFERFDKDLEFLEYIKADLAGKIVSTVYLIGDGFDGDWMKESIGELCRNRRVFSGKNLYSKGASFLGAIKNKDTDWEYVYIGDNELKLNLSLKVNDTNELKFVTLLNAGDIWYDSKGECEVILDGSQEIECWVQRPDSRNADIKVLELTGMPEREARTTRLRITAVPTSDREVTITVKDLGFGEIIPSSNMVWTHNVSLD